MKSATTFRLPSFSQQSFTKQRPPAERSIETIDDQRHRRDEGEDRSLCIPDGKFGRVRIILRMQEKELSEDRRAPADRRYDNARRASCPERNALPLKTRVKRARPRVREFYAPEARQASRADCESSIPASSAHPARPRAPRRTKSTRSSRLKSRSGMRGI